MQRLLDWAAWLGPAVMLLDDELQGLAAAESERVGSLIKASPPNCRGGVGTPSIRVFACGPSRENEGRVFRTVRCRSAREAA